VLGVRKDFDTKGDFGMKSLDLDKSLPKSARIIGNIIRRAAKALTQAQASKKSGYCLKIVGKSIRLLLSKKLIRLHYYAGHRIPNRYSAPRPAPIFRSENGIHLWYVPHCPILDGFKKREWRISLKESDVIYR
jgi:hypothetical protein